MTRAGRTTFYFVDIGAAVPDFTFETQTIFKGITTAALNIPTRIKLNRRATGSRFRCYIRSEGAADASTNVPTGRRISVSGGDQRHYRNGSQGQCENGKLMHNILLGGWDS